MRKKMNSNQNDTVLAMFFLVLWLPICLNYTPEWLQTFSFMQFFPKRTSILASYLYVIFNLALSFGFMQFYP
jgi:hypothetical protein